ncbi:uncharacterized protein LOC143119316 [Alosa pseudoharengus]|uniref:uncharacterized protein LOC143101346 n=1 Tax=Alosa pseudoharengus TaxID=34774 RepID=UPI003F8C421B
MEEEMQQMRDLIAQLKADNERLRQERPAPNPGPAPTPGPAPMPPAVTERLVVIPRDRKCPMFNGKTGIDVTEWREEVQACMRARHLSSVDQAFFIFDHLEGEAKEEIKYRSSAERVDPVKILDILRELYGCSQSYVTLQQAFFSRQQQEGETLQEFSLALLALMEQVKQRAPSGVPNADVLLRDQFVEHVLDSALRRELKQLIRRQPLATLLDVRREAIRWEQEGFPGGARARSFSLPAAYGIQYGVLGHPRSASPVPPPSGELGELKELLKQQQEQLNQLTQTVASLQNPPLLSRPPHPGPLICRRCQQPGHFARECDGERVPYRPRASSTSGPPSNLLRASHSSHQSGN